MNLRQTRRKLGTVEHADHPGEPAGIEYASAAWLPYVLLAAMPLNEAELARLKLESEGIHCTISGKNISTMHPLIFHSVELLVDPADLERARGILDTPADESMEGEYVDEPWRCPKCHRKDLEIQPAAGVRKAAWYVWWVLAALIIFNMVMHLAGFNAPRSRQAWDAATGGAMTVTLTAFVCASSYLMFGRREKVCGKCGWKS